MITPQKLFEQRFERLIVRAEHAQSQFFKQVFTKLGQNWADLSRPFE